MERAYQFISQFVSILDSDDIQHIGVIFHYLSGTFGNDLNESQLVALTSLVQDIGFDSFLESSIPQAIYNHKYIIVANQMLTYNKLGRSISISKTTRRQAELHLFTEGMK